MAENPTNGSDACAIAPTRRTGARTDLQAATVFRAGERVWQRCRWARIRRRPWCGAVLAMACSSLLARHGRGASAHNAARAS